MKTDQYPPILRFHSVAPKQNRFRFYTLAIQPTLWGEHAVIRTFGRIGAHGRRHITVHPSVAAAAADYTHEIDRRRAHRYALVYSSGLPPSP